MVSPVGSVWLWVSVCCVRGRDWESTGASGTAGAEAVCYEAVPVSMWVEMGELLVQVQGLVLGEEGPDMVVEDFPGVPRLCLDLPYC